MEKLDKQLFFEHHLYAFLNLKLIRVRMKYGMAGYGTYWALVEYVNNRGGSIELDEDSLSYLLGVDQDMIKSVINDFGLFVIRHINGVRILYPVEENMRKPVVNAEETNSNNR